MSPDAQDLITKMLDKDRKKRLGSKGDAAEILAHPFFRSLDILKVANKEFPPPFLPKVMTDEELAKLSGGSVQESIVTEDKLKQIKDRKSEFEKFGLLSNSCM